MTSFLAGRAQSWITAADAGGLSDVILARRRRRNLEGLSIVDDIGGGDNAVTWEETTAAAAVKPGNLIRNPLEAIIFL